MREPTRSPERARTTGRSPGFRRRSSSSFSAIRPTGPRRIGTSVITSVRGSSPKRAGIRFADELDHGLAHRLRGRARAMKKKSSSSSASAPSARGRPREREERQLARVDASGALDDQRARRLPVDRGQMNARHDAAVDEIGEHAARRRSAAAGRCRRRAGRDSRRPRGRARRRARARASTPRRR